MAKKQQWRNTVVTVLIADAGHMNCQLVESALRPRGRHLAVIGSAVRLNEALQVARDKQPDVAVISAELEDGALQGYRVLRHLPGVSVRTRAIMLLRSRDREMVVDAFRCGASGVVFRDEPVKTLAKSIQAVHQGQVWANSEMMRHLVDALGRAAPIPFRDGRGIELLSKREADVVRLVAEGMGNKDIAERLQLSEHTVRNYMFHIFDKLGVSTRVELVLHCLDQAPFTMATAASEALTKPGTPN